MLGGHGEGVLWILEGAANEAKAKRKRCRTGEAKRPAAVKVCIYRRSLIVLNKDPKERNATSVACE